ncbi:MAG: transglutaminase-like domain-containing protein [Myxococcota bacterium]
MQLGAPCRSDQPSTPKLTRRGLLLGGAALSACATLPPVRPPSNVLPRLSAALTRGLEGERARALALYTYVRDSIAFGFTGDFDRATPKQTVGYGRGHCNPQGALLCALFREAGLRAEQHFVTIRGAVLDGLFNHPDRLTHSYVRVWIDGEPYELDGYICDRPFFSGARARARREGRSLGYGVHIQGTVTWSGRGHAMSQLADRAMVLADHGPFEPADFYASDAYENRLGAFTRTLFRRYVMPEANRIIATLRSGEEVPAEP